MVRDPRQARGLATALMLITLMAPVLLSGVRTDPPKRSPHLLVIAVKASRLYHLPSCPVVHHAPGTVVTSVGQAERDGYRPHDCQTAIQRARKVPEAQPGAPLVWVDLKTRRYHLAGCSLVGLPRAQMSLVDAAAKYRPCNACKPPPPPAR